MPGDDYEAATPSELLTEALESLPPDDRDRVLVWLLDRIPRAVPFGAPAMPMAGEERSSVGFHAQEVRRAVVHQEVQALGHLDPVHSSDYQIVPVRLPTDLHARLRDWCREHGFSMATVVRGLLARFLEDQNRPDPKQ